MPVDANGNRADIVMDPNSTISRMNVGRLYEHYINAASRDLHQKLCSNLGIKTHSSVSSALKHINSLNDELVTNQFNYLLRYYKITSPIMHGFFYDSSFNQSKQEYLAEIVNKGIGLYIPTNNPVSMTGMIEQLETHYKPLYGPVTYTGNSGQQVTTKDPIRIGSIYFLLLEKTGDDWSAVSSGKLQNFGVLSQLTRVDKYSKPSRNQAVRGTGEAEVRILMSYIGAQYTAELMDRNNNPQTHKAIVDKILSANQPTNIDKVVNRAEIPLGGAKPLQLVNHILQCSGLEFCYNDYVEQGVK